MNDAEQKTIDQLNAETAAADLLIANLRGEVEQKETQLAELEAENAERSELVLLIETGGSS